jgi:hypothetical protein
MSTPRNQEASWLPFVLAATSGVVLWYATAMAAGKREAWDGGVYWIVGYPLSIALSALLGRRYPEIAFFWPFVHFWSQFAAMAMRNGEVGNLWPLGLIGITTLALPCAIAAEIAARFGRGNKNPGSAKARDSQR